MCQNAITHRDGGGGVEKIHVLLGARVPGTHPNFGFVMPLNPWPSQAKVSSEFCDVNYPKTTKLLWAAYGLPINLAFVSGDLVFTRPKEGSLQLVDVANGAGRDQKRRQVVDFL